MRILNLMTGKGRGGLEAMALRYHQALEAEGFDVLSLGHPKGVLSELRRFRPLIPAFDGDPLAALGLRAATRSFGAEWILTHGNRATGLATHGLSACAGRTLAVVHNFRFKPELARAQEAFCVSPAVLQAVRQAFPGLRTRLVENFLPLVMRPVKGLPRGVPVIGALGRLHVNKGFDVLLEAVASLRETGVEVRLRIGGDGPEEAALTAQAARLGLGDVVDFTGWVEQADSFLGGLDLFVLPSRVEPFGLVLAEAMAAGVPVISSAIDGPKSILRGGELGLLVAPEAPSALAEGIRTVFSGWPEALERAHEAQAHALETYGELAGRTRLKAVMQEIGA